MCDWKVWACVAAAYWIVVLSSVKASDPLSAWVWTLLWVTIQAILGVALVLIAVFAL